MSQERSVRDVSGLYTGLTGGADGIRTHDLLDAIEARSQLRHGPTEGFQFTTFAAARAWYDSVDGRPYNLRASLQVLSLEPHFPLGAVAFV